MVFDMGLLDEVNSMYKLVNKLFIVCIRKGLRLIMENPYSKEHFLHRYWCFLPKIIDMDRRLNGDYYKKPTQYWFLNIEPNSNVLFEAIPDNRIGSNWSSKYKGVWHKTGAKNKAVGRSMIHPDYADRFIRTFILDQ